MQMLLVMSPSLPDCFWAAASEGTASRHAQPPPYVARPFAATVLSAARGVVAARPPRRESEPTDHHHLHPPAQADGARCPPLCRLCHNLGDQSTTSALISQRIAMQFAKAVYPSSEASASDTGSTFFEDELLRTNSSQQASPRKAAIQVPCVTTLQVMEPQSRTNGAVRKRSGNGTHERTNEQG